ncbi:MAG: glycosyltransferase [Chloroflexota bacterium]
MTAPVARSAVVQDWFFAPGGSEEVAIEIAGLLPGSEVITSFMETGYRERLAGHEVQTWPLQRILGATKRYRNLLPLYPPWFGGLDLRDRDLVVSSSSAFAKAARTRPRTEGGLHIAYIHAPMRYAWDLDTYLAGSSVSLPGRLAARTLRPWLRRWDRSTAMRPDVLVANSGAVRDRIKRAWGRDAEVIHPPVRLDGIQVSDVDDGYLLVAARLLAYRRIDLAVRAANRLGRELVVVGDGPEGARLRTLAGPTVRFTGRLDRGALVDLFGRCHAYLVPGEEDFGMAPVEAMGAGVPVVALRAGGALETVVDGATGVLFDAPTVDALVAGIERADSMSFDRHAIRANAERFGVDVFRRRFVELLARLGVDRSLYRADRRKLELPTRGHRGEARPSAGRFVDVEEGAG